MAHSRFVSTLPVKLLRLISINLRVEEFRNFDPAACRNLLFELLKKPLGFGHVIVHVQLRFYHARNAIAARLQGVVIRLLNRRIYSIGPLTSELRISDIGRAQIVPAPRKFVIVEGIRRNSR
jgi:hypothetical protein